MLHCSVTPAFLAAAPLLAMHYLLLLPFAYYIFACPFIYLFLHLFTYLFAQRRPFPFLCYYWIKLHVCSLRPSVSTFRVVLCYFCFSVPCWVLCPVRLCSAASLSRIFGSLSGCAFAVKRNAGFVLPGESREWWLGVLILCNRMATHIPLN